MHKITLLVSIVLVLSSIAQGLSITTAGSAIGNFSKNVATNRYVFSTIVSSGTTQPTITIANFNVVSGEQIRILGLGLGGDVGNAGAVNAFRISGGGLSYSWSAGTSNSFSTNLFLGYNTDHRGLLTNTSLNLVATTGSSLTIDWIGHVDYDGGYTQATDVFGNSFNDSSYTSSIRVWVYYEVVPVPEPATIGLLILSLGILSIRRKNSRYNIL